MKPEIQKAVEQIEDVIATELAKPAPHPRARAMRIIIDELKRLDLIEMGRMPPPPDPTTPTGAL